MAALLDGATQITPKLNENPKVIEGKTALQVIGAHNYLSSAKMLRQGAAELTDPVKRDSLLETASKMESEGRKIIAAHPEMDYNHALNKLHDALQVAAETLPAEQKKAFDDVVAQREAQITLDITPNKLTKPVMELNNTAAKDDRNALRDLKSQLGVATETGRGFLRSGVANELSTHLGEAAKGGITLAEMSGIREGLKTADANTVTSGDSGIGLSATELAKVRSEIKNMNTRN